MADAADEREVDRYPLPVVPKRGLDRLLIDARQPAGPDALLHIPGEGVRPGGVDQGDEQWG